MSEPLIHNSARVLEFDALRELLRGYASSPLGQARIAALAPSTDSAWIVEQQELTGEVREFRRRGPGDHGDSRRPAGGRSRRGVARDRISSSGEHADGMAANPRAFRKRA